MLRFRLLQVRYVSKYLINIFKLLTLHPCRNEQWTLTDSGLLMSPRTNSCATVNSGHSVSLQKCEPNHDGQTWSYNKNTKQMMSGNGMVRYNIYWFTGSRRSVCSISVWKVIPIRCLELRLMSGVESLPTVHGRWFFSTWERRPST